MKKLRKVLDKFNEGFSKLDEDMIKTIEVFLKLDLNLSEASKELYVHRNTLIYRLDKIQKVYMIMILENLMMQHCLK